MFSFFLWFVRFQILICELRSIWRKILVLSLLYIRLLLKYLSRPIILLRSISSLLLVTFSVLGILSFPTQEFFRPDWIKLLSMEKNLIIFGQNLKIPTIVNAPCPYCFANEIYKQIYFLIDSKWWHHASWFPFKVYFPFKL